MLIYRKWLLRGRSNMWHINRPTQRSILHQRVTQTQLTQNPSDMSEVELNKWRGSDSGGIRFSTGIGISLMGSIIPGRLYLSSIWMVCSNNTTYAHPVCPCRVRKRLTREVLPDKFIIGKPEMLGERERFRSAPSLSLLEKKQKTIRVPCVGSYLLV